MMLVQSYIPTIRQEAWTGKFARLRESIAWYRSTENSILFDPDGADFYYPLEPDPLTEAVTGN